jgi:YbgC/YbaW family acyl-CoA thioester hydrolase
MKRSEFRALERLRVRWVEVDLQKVVFNGHYLMYFDNAMAGYWRAAAMPYAPTMAHFAGDMFVRKATVEYHGSARYDDLLDIGVRCARIGTSSMIFSGAAFLKDRLIASCELVYVFTQAHAAQPQPVPQAFRDALLAYEAGESMVDVRVGSWDELGGPAREIRTEVFLDEQKIPAAMEWDAADHECLHAVAFNRLGYPLATGRLLADGPHVARIGRMATRQSVRGSGIARRVLDALTVTAKQRGDTEVVLNAQLGAQAFYARAGFVPRGAVFDEAGIAHIAMSRWL